MSDSSDSSPFLFEAFHDPLVIAVFNGMQESYLALLSDARPFLKHEPECVLENPGRCTCGLTEVLDRMALQTPS